MKEVKLTKIILIMIIFMSSSFIHNQTIASTEGNLTEDEVFQFLNNAHNSLDLIAQESGLHLEKQSTYFSAANSSYFIAFGTGAGMGSLGAAKSARDSGKIFSSITGVTMAGVVTGAVVIAVTPLLVAGSFTTIPLAAATAVGYSLMTSTFATIIGSAISPKSKKSIPSAENIGGAAYIGSHYRLQFNYKFPTYVDGANGYELYGDSEEGSCILFFAVEKWLSGYVINHEIDSCDHAEIFQDTQIGWNLRTGKYVDIIDRALGQDKVVTFGQVKIRQN